MQMHVVLGKVFYTRTSWTGLSLSTESLLFSVITLSIRVLEMLRNASSVENNFRGKQTKLGNCSAPYSPKVDDEGSFTGELF